MEPYQVPGMMADLDHKTWVDWVVLLIALGVLLGAIAEYGGYLKKRLESRFKVFVKEIIEEIIDERVTKIPGALQKEHLQREDFCMEDMGRGLHDSHRIWLYRTEDEVLKGYRGQGEEYWKVKRNDAP